MANKRIEQIVYSFERPGHAKGITIELVYKPAYQWFSFKLHSFKEEPIDIEMVRSIFEDMKLIGHIEVQLKESYGGATYCYKNGKPAWE